MMIVQVIIITMIKILIVGGSMYLTDIQQLERSSLVHSWKLCLQTFDSGALL